MYQVSVVTPTLRRREEVKGLLENLSKQKYLPYELVLVDGAPDGETATQELIENLDIELPFKLRYFRKQGGTAIQRNYGIDHAEGDLVAFIDDDVRLEPAFFEEMAKAFQADTDKKVGGIVGYRTNRYTTYAQNTRWRLYKRFKLLTTYEPGRYDFQTGYPINANLQPPFTGVREVDFMTTACAVWRREVFDEGLRFDPFFIGYGILEDAHLSLSAGKKWKLLQCGDAKCEEMHSPSGRENRKKIGFKVVVNYYFVFKHISGPLSFKKKYRFFRYQMFELVRIGSNLVRKREKHFLDEIMGRLNGLFYCWTGRVK